ncbi:MAG: hypothetical protein AABX86_03215 [Nanoarchaeota archaeon]
MKSYYLIFTVILISCIVVGHFMALHFGCYTTSLCSAGSGRTIWVDNIFHVLAGIAFGLFLLWLLEVINFKLHYPKITLLAGVLLLALLWELIEFLLLRYSPDFALRFSIYSPTLAEAGSDILSNVFGWFILVFFTTMFKKHFARIN